jgi:hypothetical protein
MVYYVTMTLLADVKSSGKSVIAKYNIGWKFKDDV